MENRAMTSSSGLASAARAAAADLLGCLRFYSRIPVPVLPWEGDPHRVPDFRTMPRMLPLAGAVIGSVGALAMTGALGLGLGPLVSAAVAVTVLALATGAFHEDGLADSADGLGGGHTPARRLEIMRDSRVGAFGACALAASFTLRVACLATLAERTTPGAAAAALVLGAATSRTAALLLFLLVPPARQEGSSYAVGQPTARTVSTAFALAGAMALLSTPLLPAGGMALGIGLSVLAAWGMARVSLRLVGGHTGDVAGAIQQIAEVAWIIALLIALRP